MELDPYLVTVPGHMIMGVYLNEEHREQREIETTMAGAIPLVAFGVWWSLRRLHRRLLTS